MVFPCYRLIAADRNWGNSGCNGSGNYEDSWNIIASQLFQLFPCCNCLRFGVAAASCPFQLFGICGSPSVKLHGRLRMRPQTNIQCPGCLLPGDIQPHGFGYFPHRKHDIAVQYKGTDLWIDFQAVHDQLDQLLPKSCLTRHGMNQDSIPLLIPDNICAKSFLYYTHRHHNLPICPNRGNVRTDLFSIGNNGDRSSVNFRNRFVLPGIDWV